MSVNKAILVGHLGRDPELRASKNGKNYCTFSLATNRRKPVGDGQWEDATEWHRVVVFGSTADTCAKYLNKGRQVYVEGRIETSKYGEPGQEKYSTKIVAGQVRFMGSGRSAQARAGDRAVPPTPAPAESTGKFVGTGTDDDIPF